MRIALVRPDIGRLEHGPFDDRARMEPLALGVLSALTPPGDEPLLRDDRCAPLDYDEKVDLAAITVETFTARRAYEIAAEYRARGVPVVMGGIHPTLIPDEAAAHADSICVGEAEPVWAAMVEDARAGSLKPVYRGGTGVPQVVPGACPLALRACRDWPAGSGYLPLGLVQFGRGCRYRCEFCAVSASSGAGHRARDVAEAAAEAAEALRPASGFPGERRRKRSAVFFVDDNIVADRAAAKELFRALVPLKLSWVSQASLDMLEDDELMGLMAESGCLGNVIGFESVDERNVRAMGKVANRGGGLERYQGYVEKLRSFGLQTWAAFTLGHEYDTPESIRELLDFALRSTFAFAAFNVLMPYPGTLLYARLSEEGRLLYGGRWWLSPDYRFNHAAFVPRLMTPDQLTEAGLECRRLFNSFPSILSRAFGTRTNLRNLFRLGLALSYGTLFRREAFKKQGMLLGRS